jgi:hypothetical protein
MDYLAQLTDVAESPYSMLALIALAALVIVFLAYAPVQYVVRITWLATKSLRIGTMVYHKARKALRGVVLRMAESIRRARERRMSNEVRQQYVMRLLADVITDGLEDKLLHGKIRRSEVNSLYELVGAKCGVADLLRKSSKPDRPEARKAQQKLLKKAITLRLGEDKVREFMATRRKRRVIIIPSQAA